MCAFGVWSESQRYVNFGSPSLRSKSTYRTSQSITNIEYIKANVSPDECRVVLLIGKEGPEGGQMKRSAKVMSFAGMGRDAYDWARVWLRMRQPEPQSELLLRATLPLARSSERGILVARRGGPTGTASNTYRT